MLVQHWKMIAYCNNPTNSGSADKIGTQQNWQGENKSSLLKAVKDKHAKLYFLSRWGRRLQHRFNIC